MKSIYLYIIGILVVGAAAMPFFVKKQVDTKIQSEKQSLAASGVTFEILNEEGYISSTREFELKITNGKKFRDYALTKFAEKNPNYRSLTEMLQKNSEKDIRPALDGTAFTGTIKNSNLLLSAPLIELSLIKLSDEIMSHINNDTEVSKVIISMLDEKMFTFYITLDSNEKISQILMKDIDKNIENNGKTVKFKLEGHELNLDITESLAGSYKVDKQLIKADEFYMQTKGVKYSFDYLTKFENSTALHVDNFELKKDNVVLKIGNIDITNDRKTVENNTLKIDAKCTVKDIFFLEKESLELNSFTFEFSISELNKQSVVLASESYNKLVLNTNQTAQKDLMAAMTKVLNKGFKSTIESSLSGLIFQNKTFKNIDLILNLQVKSNTYDINGFDMIKALELNGTITLNEESLKQMVILDKRLERFAKLGKKDDNNMVFDYEFKQESLYINGTKI